MPKLIKQLNYINLAISGCFANLQYLVRHQSDSNILTIKKNQMLLCVKIDLCSGQFAIYRLGTVNSELFVGQVCFELIGNLNYKLFCNSNLAKNYELEISLD